MLVEASAWPLTGPAGPDEDVEAAVPFSRLLVAVLLLLCAVAEAEDGPRAPVPGSSGARWAMIA